MIAGSVRFHPPQMFAVEAFCQSLERATKIADVLEFPLFHDRPDWASERGQVVQLIRSNVAGRWEAVSISSRGTRKGLAATSADEVIGWMNGQSDIERNPAFCYPGSHIAFSSYGLAVAALYGSSCRSKCVVALGEYLLQI